MGLHGGKNVWHDWSLQVAAAGGPAAGTNVVLNNRAWPGVFRVSFFFRARRLFRMEIRLGSLIPLRRTGMRLKSTAVKAFSVKIRSLQLPGSRLEHAAVSVRDGGSASNSSVCI